MEVRVVVVTMQRILMTMIMVYVIACDECVRGDEDGGRGDGGSVVEGGIRGG